MGNKDYYTPRSLPGFRLGKAITLYGKGRLFLKFPKDNDPSSLLSFLSGTKTVSLSLWGTTPSVVGTTVIVALIDRTYELQSIRVQERVQRTWSGHSYLGDFKSKSS